MCFTLQQMIDIVMGAIDAWLSLDVRRAAKSYSTASNEGGSTLLKSMMACERGNFRVSIRDGLIGAGVMIVGSLILVGFALRQRSGRLDDDERDLEGARLLPARS